jgi:hypothetical protein
MKCALSLSLLIAACGFPKLHFTGDGGGDDSGDALTATTAIAAILPTASFTAPTGVATLVPYGAELYDDLDEFDTTTSKFHPKRAGDYLICAGAAGSGPFRLDIYDQDIWVRGFSGTTSTTTGCTVLRIAADDSIELRVSQTTGSVMTFTPDFWGWLTIEWQPSVLGAVMSNAQIVLASSGFTPIPYDQLLYGDSSHYSAQGYQAPTDGDYEVCASFAIASSNIHITLDVFVAGMDTTVLAQAIGGVHGCTTVSVLGGQTISVRASQDSGNPVTPAINQQQWDWLAIQQLPARVRANAVTAFTSGSFAVVPYTGVNENDGEFDAVAYSLTAATAGDYQLCAALLINYMGELDVFKNGSRECGLQSTPAIHASGCRVLRLAAGDVLNVEVSPATITPPTPDPWDWLELSKLK